MRVSTALILIPVTVVAAVIAIANPDPVIFRLDPFSRDHPALAFEVPLYLLVFLALLTGVLLGGAVVGLKRRARRRPEMFRGGSGPAQE